MVREKRAAEVKGEEIAPMHLFIKRGAASSGGTITTSSSFAKRFTCVPYRLSPFVTISRFAFSAIDKPAIRIAA